MYKFISWCTCRERSLTQGWEIHIIGAWDISMTMKVWDNRVLFHGDALINTLTCLYVDINYGAVCFLAGVCTYSAHTDADNRNIRTCIQTYAYKHTCIKNTYIYIQNKRKYMYAYTHGNTDTYVHIKTHVHTFICTSMDKLI